MFPGQKQRDMFELFIVNIIFFLKTQINIPDGLNKDLKFMNCQRQAYKFFQCSFWFLGYVCQTKCMAIFLIISLASLTSAFLQEMFSY